MDANLAFDRKFRFVERWQRLMPQTCQRPTLSNVDKKTDAVRHTRSRWRYAPGFNNEGAANRKNDVTNRAVCAGNCAQA